MGGTSSVVQERGVSNHSGHRSISNALDATVWSGGYQSTSGSRALCHGVYHQIVADKKLNAGNREGYEAEMQRARQQAEVFEGSSFKRALDGMMEAEKWGGMH
ncbi:unnamed protein product [Effrenium voratum]|nr:unnamed protein product [Effrenium voratum]CAJ1436499.1 unnamed protein product [Effrenium voratum]